MTSLSALADSRELLANLTARELRGKYKRSTLGWAWSLLNPLVLAGMFTVVFSLIFRAPAPVGHPSGLKVFPLFLLIGLLPWNFVSNGINGAIDSLTSNANLVKKVYFPREVLVGASVLSWLVSLGIEVGVLVLALLVAGNMVLPWLPVLVVLLVLQTVFVVGVGLALSVLNVYFRDVQHFVALFLQLWFYATPIVYPLSFVQSFVERHHAQLHGVPVLALYHLNPMVGFVESYRRVLYDLRWPAFGDLAYITVASVGMLLVGALLFRRFEPRLAEEL